MVARSIDERRSIQMQFDSLAENEKMLKTQLEFAKPRALVEKTLTANLSNDADNKCHSFPQELAFMRNGVDRLSP